MAVEKKTEQIATKVMNKQGVAPGQYVLVTFSNETGDVIAFKRFGSVEKTENPFPTSLKRNEMWIVISQGGWSPAKLKKK